MSKPLTPADYIVALRSIAERHVTDERFDDLAQQITGRMLRARADGEHGGVYIWGILDDMLAKLLTSYFRERQVQELPLMEHIKRRGDMDPDSAITLIKQEDGDMILTVHSTCPYRATGATATIEFCTLTGGGKSPRTRAALQVLMQAIIDDNAEDKARSTPRHARGCALSNDDAGQHCTCGLAESMLADQVDPKATTDRIERPKPT